MPKGNQGRPRYGEDKGKPYFKLAVSMSEDLDKRLTDYCESEDRSKSWVVRQAIDKFLEEKGF